MLQIIIKNLADYIQGKNRWWIALITGCFFALCQPPINHETHWVLAPFPFLSLIVLVPLFFFAILKPLKRAMLYTYLYSFAAALVQYYWIGFVTAEGLWHLILIGLCLISATIGLMYFAAGMLFRLIYRHFSRWYIIIFPAIWVCIDYLRSIGDISFPWSLLGYSLTPVLPIAQLATITGVWGLTFLVVIGNILIFELLKHYYINENQTQKWIHVSIFGIFLIVLSIWGYNKIQKPINGSTAKVALLQGNLDQLHWGNNSLDTAFSITETMIAEAAKTKPELIVGSESQLLCYLAKRPDLSDRVLSWVDRSDIPLIIGALHWERAPEGSPYKYLVYNTAFLAEPDSLYFKSYHKMQLVPFSECMPFEQNFPILSRVNLGEADFQRGKEHTLFSINKIKTAPFICYEIIYPSFVQKRLQNGANLICAITNDGWFGKSSGPYQHAMMARMRAIENRMYLIRSANSGISMIVDPVGRVVKQTSLYTRTMLDGNVILKKGDTFYHKYGDWMIILCNIISIAALIIVFVKMLHQQFMALRKKRLTALPQKSSDLTISA
jgi:apolipoprotein N-acyltransferase